MFQEVLELGAACTFFKHRCAAVAKSPVIWAQGLLHLCLLFHHQTPQHSPNDAAFGHVMRGRFQQLGVTPNKYTWPWFQANNAVYVKLQVWRHFKTLEKYRQPSPMLYIGSTSVSVTLRESNRMSVFKRLQNHQEAQVELAVRYWHSAGNFEAFSVVAITACESYRAAWIFEHSLIELWQPKLNFPFIQQFLKRSALGFRPAKRRRMTAYGRFGLRLWRKLRKRLYPTRQPLAMCVSRRHAWEMLFDLTSFTAASFRANKTLRSTRFTDDEVYAMFRLSMNLEEPLRSRARQFLKQVAHFRNMTWPVQNAPLAIQFLAPDDFPKQISRWLRAQVLRYKWMLVPFHLPPHTVREAPHQSLREFLHNTQFWDQRVSSCEVQQLKCPCASHRSRLPPNSLVDSHVACGIEDLVSCHQWLRPVATASASSTFFPAKHYYMQHNRLKFSRWRRKHGFPPSLEDEFVELLWQLWEDHRIALDHHHRFTWADIHKTRHILHKQFVIHNEDHHNSHLMVYCPRFYYQAVLRTWDDPEVFQPLTGTAEEWQSWVVKQIPKSIQKRYAWGVECAARIPRGFVFLKRKKQFRTGRTIISYASSVLARLLAAASQAIALMIHTVWWDGLGLDTMPRLWQRMHTFFRDTPSEVHLQEVNDDLIGFFNSVPRLEILRALDCLMAEYKAAGHEADITVVMRPQQGQEKAFPGRPWGGCSRGLKAIRQSDLAHIVELSFTTGVFEAAGRVCRQTRGTCIGNQTSPILSSLPVIFRERSWRKSWAAQEAFQKYASQTPEFLMLRYVDNRILLASQDVLRNSAFHEFAQLSFYGGSIQLEAVSDHRWLGFVISAPARTATYCQPEQPWQIRHPDSAGSWAARASGYHSRKALILKYTWPPGARQSQVARLRHLYIAKGFPPSALA